MDKVDERLEKMTPLQRAVFALKETRARLDALEQQQAQPIAVVGMACRLPGGANDPASYWQLLCDGVHAVGETPPDRWNVDAFYDPDPAVPGKTHTRVGGFLKQVDEFDNHFFGISDREAGLIDPQQRLLLELSWEALEDAGLPPASLRGARVGVFVGLSNSDYGMLLFRDTSQSDAFANTGVSPCIAANRISFAFDFSGPSLTTDTACSSSLVAMHLACQSIRNGDSEAALVGGVNLMLSPVPTINLGKAGFLAADGCIHAFDAAASGYVRGEGAGVVVLKPLSAAQEDGDPIYAVIRGSAVNQNGASNGLTAPSRQAQEKALRQAYEQAKVSPGEVQYVETQGTGTRLGDAIEAMALGTVMKEGRPLGDRCAIGSVKTNIGHLEAASGMASVIKVALALKHGELPATLHFQTPNPDIPFSQLPIAVQQSHGPWPDTTRAKLAGVSAFGFGGSNAHIVLEEAPTYEATEPASVGANEGTWLLPLSARTEKALDDLVRRYIAFLGDAPPMLRDVCHTAARRREHHDCRLAVVAASHGEAIEQLESFLAGTPNCRVFTGRRPVGRDPKIALIYAGRVGDWAPYGHCMDPATSGWKEALDEADRTLQRLANWSLEGMFNDLNRWANPDYSQPAAVTMQTALTSWFRSVGITPDVAFGQGVGELSAACAAGMLTAEEAVQLAVAGDGVLTRMDSFPSRPPSLPFISTRAGQARNMPNRDTAHENQLEGASDDLVAALGELHRRHVDCCLEIGPAYLTARIAQSSSDSDSAMAAVPSFGPPEAKDDGVLPALGAIYAAGGNLQWDRIASPSGCCVNLPGYPWQRQRLWAIKNNPFVSATSEMAESGRAAQAGASETDRPMQVSADDPLERVEIRTRPDLNTPFVAPRTQLEEEMERSWSEILRVERVGMYDSFFELGGDSLQATILLNRLQEQLGETVDAHVLFQAQTINDMATHLRSHYPNAIGRLHPDEAPSLASGSGSDNDADDVTPAVAAIPRLSRESEAERMLSHLDELTDEEVNSLLQETFANSEPSNE